MFGTISSETSNPFRSFLFAVDCLIPPRKAILSGAGHKGYLSAFVKSIEFPDFNDQEMVLAMVLEYTVNLHFHGSSSACE